MQPRSPPFRRNKIEHFLDVEKRADQLGGDVPVLWVTGSDELADETAVNDRPFFLPQILGWTRPDLARLLHTVANGTHVGFLYQARLLRIVTLERVVISLLLIGGNGRRI